MAVENSAKMAMGYIIPQMNLQNFDISDIMILNLRSIRLLQKILNGMFAGLQYLKMENTLHL